MRIFSFSPRFLMPLMIFAGVMMMGVRAGDIWRAIEAGTLFVPVQEVQAEEKKAAPSPEQETPGDAPSAPAAVPAKEEPLSSSDALYKQLTGRRDQLERRAKELDAREAVISVAEKRVDQKLKEMETLRAQLQSLLGQASAGQVQQLDNLVKIYETMKPKEAARIFETLELSVLMNVVQRMKPARTAAVMAEMDPLKAREITIALTRQDQLPKVQ